MAKSRLKRHYGVGTRFTLKVPLTLIISQALFVRCGDYTFAFPLAFVEEIRRMRDDEIEEVGGKLLTKVRDVVTEVVRLDQQLGLAPIEPVNGWYRLVLVNVGGSPGRHRRRRSPAQRRNRHQEHRRVSAQREAVPGRHHRARRQLDSAGRSEPPHCWRIHRAPSSDDCQRMLHESSRLAPLQLHTERFRRQRCDVVEREKVIVLADDSISVRKFVGRMLEKAGYRVKLAADGLEALEIVTARRMRSRHHRPRDAAHQRIRIDDALAAESVTPQTFPMMVVTSRAGAKHRDRALKEGAIGIHGETCAGRPVCRAGGSN